MCAVDLKESSLLATQIAGGFLKKIRYDNVNASTRALIWSTTLDGRGPLYNLAKKGRDANLCHGPQLGARWLQSGRPFEKKNEFTKGD